MNKVVQAFLTGVFTTFVLDYFLFLGIFQHYINFHDIDVYFNILFIDHQNEYIFFSLSAVLGFFAIYVKNYKVILISLSILSFLVMLTLFEDIGRNVGERMFMTKNVTIKSGEDVYSGDILYDGRVFVHLYDYKYEKIIKLNKKDLDK